MWGTFWYLSAMRNFETLTEREVIALAISLEEDERIYADYAEGMRTDFPGTAAVFDGMRQEEIRPPPPPHGTVPQRYGDHIPLIRRRSEGHLWSANRCG